MRRVETHPQGQSWGTGWEKELIPTPKSSLLASQL